MRSIVKHRYVKGRLAKQKAKAHVRYLQYRDGPDLEDCKDKARKFFNAKEDEVLGFEVRKQIIANEDRSGVVHKIILSPGDNSVDLQDYTRHLMTNLSREKGLDLDWNAVIHRNTEHHHVHVVLMGTNNSGQLIRLNRTDYQLLREIGDRYLERELGLDAYGPDKGLEKLLQEQTYNRDKGDPLYEGLIEELLRKKEEEEKRAQDLLERLRVEEDFEELFQQRRGSGHYRPKGREQRTFEARGRLLEWHERYEMHKERSRLADVLKANPDKAEDIAEELEWLDELYDQPTPSRLARGELTQPAPAHEMPAASQADAHQSIESIAAAPLPQLGPQEQGTLGDTGNPELSKRARDDDDARDQGR